MAEDRTILLKVELDVTQLKKNSEEAAAKLEQLKVKQTLLRNQNQQGTVEYAKLAAEIRKTSKELNDGAKALSINERLTKQNSGSMNELKEQMLASKIALGQMSEEMRKSESGQRLIKDIDTLNESLKDTEESYGVYSRSVGNYAGKLSEIKAELKAIKGEMVGLDAGSARYQELSEKAGVLGDKIKEVNENTKAQAGGTGFEKLSNNLGLVRGDLENLDFEGVSEKMGQMAQISKGMTFKEVLGGLKNMGSSLLSLAKTILLNPLFIMAGVIVGVGVALKAWNDSVKAEAVAAQKAHTKSIEENIKAMKQQQESAQEFSDLYIRKAELEGKTAKEIGDKKIAALKGQNESEKLLFQENERLMASLRKDQRLAEEIEDQEAIQAKIDAVFEENEALVHNKYTYGVKLQNLEMEINNDILEEQKASAEKRKANAQKAYDDRIALEREMSDLLFEGVNLSNENEEKRINAKYEFLVNTAQDNNEEILRLEGEKNAELEALDIKTKEQEKARVTEQYRREIEDAKGKKDIIKQLKINEALEKEQIDLDYNDKTLSRSVEYQNKIKEIEKKKISDAKRIAGEIEIIDAEINLLKTKGSKDELSAWSNLQFAKVRQLEAISALELENANLTKDEKIKIAKETELAIQQIQAQTFESSKDKTKQQTEWTQEQKKSVALASVQAAQQMSDIFFQIANNQIQKELNDEQQKYDTKSEMLQNQLDNGIISQADYNAQKSALDSQYAAKEKSLKEEQFKKQKAAQLINATISAAVGVVNALAAPPPIGLIMASIAGALGAAQIALIASQPTPTFERGGEPLKSGIFGGRPHSQGGTKGVFEDGTQIEVERDEAFFVLNKKSSMIPALSALNVKGGGVPFMEKGGVLKFAGGGALANSITQPIDNQLDMQNQMLIAMRSAPAPVVLVEDINSAQGTLATVIERANY